ncbi:MAG: hypothetical protein ACI84K_000626 [Pseudohongiellaceae bacterium]|jgi:hypothetical protein
MQIIFNGVQIMRIVARLFLCSTVIFLLASCASSPVEAPPKITSIQSAAIESASDKAALESIYSQLTADLASTSAEAHPQEFSMLTQVKSRLSDIVTTELSLLIEESKNTNSIIVIQALEAINTQALALNELAPDKYLDLKNTLQVERSKTEKYIATTSAKLATLSDNALRDKLQTLKELYELTGNIEYQTQKDTLISDIETQIDHSLLADKVDEDLAERLSILKLEQPENKIIKNKLATVNGKIFEQRFFAALANDKPMQAYEHFLTLTTTEDFVTIKSNLHETGETMAQYFSALGTEATSEDKLLSAYKWHARSKNVQSNLDISANSSSTNSFIEKVVAEYHKSMERRNFELGLGYLKVIKEFSPQHSLLRTATRKTYNQVLQRALLQVSTTAFTNSDGAHDFGNNVSAKITQHLFNNLPNDVRIIEREQYDAILREVELNQNNGEEKEDLVSVDYIITGNVLEAKVDSQKVQGKKTVRVTSGTHRVRNPEFTAWSDLPKDNRDDIEQPPAMIVEDVVEDVSIKLTKHRKTGVFSVSYRLVDAASGKVLLPNSITLTEQFSDTSTEGVELGDFSLPFKLAELPSDLEILGSLASKAAETVGLELVEKLKNPEARYLEEGQKSATDQNFFEATISFARALTLSDFKDLPTDKLDVALKDNTMATHSY